MRARSITNCWFRRLLPVLLLFLPLLAHAAVRDHYFQRLDSRQGLAPGSVTAMLQDREGFVWVATDSSLQRFDGHRFLRLDQLSDLEDPPGTVLALAQGPDDRLYLGTAHDGLRVLDLDARVLGPARLSPESPGEPAMRIDALLQQAGVGLWIGDAKGVGLLKPDSGRFSRVLDLEPRLAADTTPDATRITALALDPEGMLWVASDHGVDRIDPRDRSVTRLMEAPANALVAGPDGSLWIGTPNGIHHKPPDTLATRRVWPRNLPESGEGACCDTISLALAPDGTIWLAVREGNVWRFDPTLEQSEFIAVNPWVDGMLDERDVPRMMVDRSNLLWLGGKNRGIRTTSLDGAPFRIVFDLDPRRDLLSSNYILSLLEDEDGLIWLGSRSGLRSYDRMRNRLRVHEIPALIGGHGVTVAIHAVARADASRIWLATQIGLFQVDRNTLATEVFPLGDPAAPVPVTALAVAPDGTLWLARGDAHELLKVRPDGNQVEHFPFHLAVGNAVHASRVEVILEDSRQRVWVGGPDGLALFDHPSASFTPVPGAPGSTVPTRADRVHAIHEARDGSIWVGTERGPGRVTEAGNGRLLLEPWYGPGAATAQPILAIAEDVEGFLWLSSNDALIRLDRSNHSALPFNASASLRGMTFNPAAAISLRDGHLAFGGVQGLSLVNPAQVAPSNFDPPVVLTWIALGHDKRTKVLGAVPRIRMSASKRVLAVGFAALDFATPSNNQFSYLLEGLDTEFSQPGTSRMAAWSNLAPGNYLLRVRASNHDGMWGARQLQVPIEILPPWWAAWPAKTGYLLASGLVLAMLWFLARRRTARRDELLVQIREREERLKLSLWGAGNSFWDWDLRTDRIHQVEVDRLLETASDQELSTDQWHAKAVHPDDLPRLQQLLEDHLAGHTDFYESEHRVRNNQDGWTWVRERGKVVARDPQARPLRMAGIVRDVGARRTAERERRIAIEVLRSMSEAVAVLDLNFRFASVNPAFLRMTGYREVDVLGMPDSLLQSSRHPVEYFRQMHTELETRGHFRGEIWLHRYDGDEFLGWTEISEIRDAAGARTHYVAVLNDITEKKRTEQELRYLANYDTLTGLPNRSLLSERLARAVVRARRHDRKVAILFLDLDHFKVLNDSLGHATGDRILKATSARLLDVVGGTDTVARLGGDEFTIIMEDIDEPEAASAMAEAILAAFQTPLMHAAHGEVIVSPSIGISLYPEHAQVPVNLLKYADAAMYRAKERGRNTYQFYDTSLETEVRRRASMTSALRRALDRDELHLEFQPRQCLHDNRIVGTEALLRWTTEEFGQVPPPAFIPLAEETGLILPIGEWALEQACRSLRQWNEQLPEPLSVAVNVSVLQLLRGDLPAAVARVLEKTGLPADRLELEITESIAMANAEQTVNVLRKLKQIGVSIVIDDFGTGYSSLIYLKRLPIDALKIDREFVRDLSSDPDDAAIVTTIISMAHSLGLNVVAEGVETLAQLHYLREHGCDEIQGFLLSHAMRPEECLAFLHERAQRHAKMSTG